MSSDCNDTSKRTPFFRLFLIIYLTTGIPNTSVFWDGQRRASFYLPYTPIFTDVHFDDGAYRILPAFAVLKLRRLTAYRIRTRFRFG